MYGSNYSAQALTTKRFSTIALEESISQPKIEKKKSFLFFSLATLILVISTASFAGSSQPKLAGNNGNAKGR